MRVIESIGTIQIDITRCSLVLEPRSRYDEDLRTSNQMKFSEQRLKASLATTAGLAPEGRYSSDSPPSMEWYDKERDPNPFLQFIFKYKPRAILENEGTIPPRVGAEVLEPDPVIVQSETECKQGIDRNRKRLKGEEMEQEEEKPQKKKPKIVADLTGSDSEDESSVKIDDEKNGSDSDAESRTLLGSPATGSSEASRRTPATGRRPISPPQPGPRPEAYRTPRTAREAVHALSNSLHDPLSSSQQRIIGDLLDRVYARFKPNNIGTEQSDFLLPVEGRDELAGVFAKHRNSHVSDSLLAEVAPKLEEVMNGMLRIPSAPARSGRIAMDDDAVSIKDWTASVESVCDSIFSPTNLRPFFPKAIDLTALLTKPDAVLSEEAHRRFRAITLSLIHPQQTQKNTWARAVNEAVFLGTNPRLPTPALNLLLQKGHYACMRFRAFLHFRNSSNSNRNQILGSLKPSKFPHQILIGFLLLGVRGLLGAPMSNRTTFHPGVCLMSDLMGLRESAPPEPIWWHTRQLIIRTINENDEHLDTRHLAAAIRQDFLAFCSINIPVIPFVLLSNQVQQLPSEVLPLEH
ncbi:uncharacterized protein PGTG_09563 [Puccinia graminis f. sp. tritici CRL 75-36-700-3]|uniref:DUF7918 domain-containing protein n=1 Tax=Puccinia graminis f. sp. tritici (strain CRL 75-36-700-3 / race SCCL) TaxID=418459 RepID=E3KHS5_PUCGT|nr:uncharacterized protein PGTG_09563 [Puccinia graminis f. sp. tritici CRL 75-36-700-3]EFP83850.2 hypothetical protein PGTG_09563 [Puccinia graminis f. sp. tritici CRL 75-36-700-3]